MPSTSLRPTRESGAPLGPLLELSPVVQLSQLNHNGKKITVVREDLLPGGTKQRALAPFVCQLLKQGFDHIVYPSPFCGFAQVAVSHVCKILDVRCTIVAEVSPKTLRMHEYTCLAAENGANIVAVQSLGEAEQTSKLLCRLQKNSYKAPLGFDNPDYRIILKNELQRQWRIAIQNCERKPRALWLPVGSGTLARVFSQFIPKDIRIHCVNVHVLPSDDIRIRSIRETSSITLFSSQLEFAQAATELPNIPSNIFYDAKIWKFIKQHGEDGDIWWNVGR